jgi:hypothetical protein
MNDYDRGAYTPQNDAPLSFDARQARGRGGGATTLIISLLILAGLGVAIFMFYRSGVRSAGEAPVPVGTPVGQIKAPPPVGQAPSDAPAAGLQIYKADAPPARPPVFAAPPEQPQPRPAPSTPQAVAPVVTHTVPQAAPPPPAPAMVAASGATTKAAPMSPPPAVVAQTRPAPAAAPGDAIGDLLHAKAKSVAASPAPPVVHGAAVAQIGAYSSASLAGKGWSDIAAAFGADMSGKGKVVEPVEHDGKTLFRAAVSGFASRADATAFCGKLKAAGHACIVK